MPLTNRFRFGDTFVLWGRARLLADRVVLSWFGWSGLRRRTILLDEIERLDWWAAFQGDANLTMTLRSGETLALQIEASGLWKYEIEERAPRLRRTTTDRPSPMASAA